MLRPASRSVLAAILVCGACGTDAASPELVATESAGPPTLLGVGAGAAFWTVSTGAAPQIAGCSLDTLPAAPVSIAAAPGPIAHVGDHVLYATDTAILRGSLGAGPMKVRDAEAEAVMESDEADPITAWSTGALLLWGNGDEMNAARLSKVTRIDQIAITTRHLYVGGDGTSERRVFRIDRRTVEVTPLAASSTFAAMFPGAGAPGATYAGRLVGANDAGGFWLVEERAANASTPSRAILVALPVDGEPTVLLDRIGAVSGFFSTPEGFSWQEGDAILSAPASGGAATLVAHIDGRAGAVADGFVYYVNGTAIERLALE